MLTSNIPRDASGNQIGSGRYVVTAPGQRPALVEIQEDCDTDELYCMAVIESDPRMQRVDEMSPDVTFHRIPGNMSTRDALSHYVIDDPEIDGFGEAGVLVRIENLLQSAAGLRQQLRQIELELRIICGVEIGESSDLADRIMAAVRDGIGGPIELHAASIG